MDIDKIPIKLVKEDPVTETYHLGTLQLTKAEYANAEKINQIIDQLLQLSKRITLLEHR